MRKTKIVSTIGPASSDVTVLEQMMTAGMNVARLNFSHGTHADHATMIASIKSAREKLGLPVAIMLDTKGPEYRIGTFANGKETLAEGDTFIFTPEKIEGTHERVSVSYEHLAKELNIGDRVLVNNGLLIFEVTAIDGDDLVTRVLSGGVISNRKSMSFPGKVLQLTYLSEQDKSDLLFGIEHGIDFVACSFVSRKQDLLDVQEFLHANGGDDISLIAKIENQSGIDNIEEICEACDGIMIGRGDMGVEIPFEELPAIQKHLITKCRMLGKRVITATEMLESMISNPRPTRAEITDVANAVFDGTSAVMLSGETAAGKYPVLVIETMSRIVAKAEESLEYKKQFYTSDFTIRNSIDAISHSVCAMSMDLDAKAIAVCTMSGTTARMVSRFRPPVDIVGLCVSERTWRKLALSWGVLPIMCDVLPSIEVMFYEAKRLTDNALNLKPNDTVIITGGTRAGFAGNTNTIRIDTV